MVVPAGTQHQFVNTGPTPLVSFHFVTRHYFLNLRKKQETDTINPRSSTQSILPPNTTPKPFIRQRKKATRKKRTGKTRRRIGVGNLRRRTKRMVLLILVGNIECGYLNIIVQIEISLRLLCGFSSFVYVQGPSSPSISLSYTPPLRLQYCRHFTLLLIQTPSCKTITTVLLNP